MFNSWGNLINRQYEDIWSYLVLMRLVKIFCWWKLHSFILITLAILTQETS